jgi:hypothetical protein
MPWTLIAKSDCCYDFALYVCGLLLQIRRPISTDNLGRSLASRTSDQFAVRLLQPADHGECQGHGGNIKGFATHKMVIL